MPLIWPSQRIVAAIDDGTIPTGHPPDADRVQPASLDLRLGPTAYRLPASFLPGPGRSVRDRPRDLSRKVMTGRSTPRSCRARSRSLPRPAAGWQLRFREGGASEPGRILPVTVDLDPDGKTGGIVGYRTRKTSGLIDMSRIGAYPRETLWEPLTPRPGTATWCPIRTKFYILASAEAVVVQAGEAQG